jgi:fructokinase
VSRTDGPRIGIDLGGTKIEAALLDGTGRVMRRERVPTPRHDYAKTIETIHELVQQLEHELGRPASVGLGTPGAISPATGRIKNANSTWLNGRPLLADLQRALEREVRLANDADCFALSEAVDGAGRDAETVFGVILGTGVGGGIVHRRRLLSGPNAIAGEWGHNPLPWPMDEERPGPDCYCGRSGCIETFVSGPGLERDYAAKSGAARPAAEIVAVAAEGDEQADAALQRYEGRLARALASVINVVDPHVIVLGGGLSQISRLYENVPAMWGPFVFSDRVDTRLVPPVHGDSGGVRGAAWLW